MALDLAGKAVRLIKLPAYDYIDTPIMIVPVQVGEINTRYFIISIYDDLGTISLGNFEKAQLYCQLSDGERLYTDCEISKDDNTVTVNFGGSLTAQDGKVTCNIILYSADETEVLVSRTFYVVVYNSQANDAVDENDPNYNLLLKLLKETEEINEACQVSTAESIAATEESIKATAASKKATEASVTATSESITATEASVKATTESVSATEASVTATAESVSATAESKTATEASIKATNDSKAATTASITATEASETATEASVKATAESVAATKAAVTATEESKTATTASISATTESRTATEASIKATEASNTATAASVSATDESKTATEASVKATAESRTATADSVKATAESITATEASIKATDRLEEIIKLAPCDSEILDGNTKTAVVMISFVKQGD